MHYLNPRHDHAHILIVYRNFQARQPGASHIGLGVNGLHTARVLRSHRIRADVVPAWEPKDIADALAEMPSVTHCLIEALWVGTAALSKLLNDFPRVHFIVRVHSEVGFLQVEPGAIILLREQILLAEQNLNLSISANSARLTDFLQVSYGAGVLHLPNLYHSERVEAPHALHRTRGTLRIGSFGALRWMKNHPTAAAAALAIARHQGEDLEFWLSVDRVEHGKTVLQSVRNLFADLPWAKVVECPWQSWPAFRRTIGEMDLALQVSFTETFNIVSADAVAEGVPSVVSHAVEWAPEAWKAHPDDIAEMTRIGCALLASPSAVADGQRALKAYGDKALATWKKYLENDPAGLQR